MVNTFIIGDIVQHGACTGRIIKFRQDDSCQVRYYDNDMQRMRIEEVWLSSLELSNDEQISMFLSAANLQNKRLNYDMGSRKRREANVRRYERTKPALGCGLD